MTTQKSDKPDPHATHHDMHTHTPEPPKVAPKATRAPRTVEPPPAVSALLPASAAIGDPSFMLRVIGSGFDPTSVIVFGGEDEPTTFVSDVELTTGVNMPLWQGPDPAIPVLVRTAGVDSNVLNFAFTEPREVPLDPAHASLPVPSMNLITPM